MKRYLLFSEEKDLKLTPKMTKITEFSNSQSFYEVFVKCLTYFVNCNALNGQQGKRWLSSSLYQRVYCVFLNIKMSQIDTEIDKKDKIFHFSKILQIFCQMFAKTRELDSFKGSTRSRLVLE